MTNALLPSLGNLIVNIMMMLLKLYPLLRKF